VSGPAGADRLAGFGRWLARERELRGLGLDEVARKTRLAPGVVEAIEVGDRQRMPPRAYAVGYLRSYAAAVGLDADDVVLRWEEALASAPVELGPPARGARRAVAAAVVVLVLAALVVALVR
jgi:transcriptional regulator with XRE-family HTH domain